MSNLLYLSPKNPRWKTYTKVLSSFSGGAFLSERLSVVLSDARKALSKLCASSLSRSLMARISLSTTVAALSAQFVCVCVLVGGGGVDKTNERLQGVKVQHNGCGY